MYTVSLTVPMIEADSPEDAARQFQSLLAEYATLWLSYDVKDEDTGAASYIELDGIIRDC